MAVSLVVAALIAEGESKIYGMSHILRGYDNLVKKLIELGAEISVFDNENSENIMISKAII